MTRKEERKTPARLRVNREHVFVLNGIDLSAGQQSSFLFSMLPRISVGEVSTV